MSIPAVLRAAVVAAVALAVDVSARLPAGDELGARGFSARESGAPPFVRPVFGAPVPGEIIDHFDHNAGPYGAGSRGATFAAQPGADISAVGTGTVTFAGAVAGRTWVTVQHPNGLRSTVGELASVEVRRGETVGRGTLLGTSVGAVLLTIRDGDRYLDPEPLLLSGSLRARLVPSPP